MEEHNCSELEHFEESNEEHSNKTSYDIELSPHELMSEEIMLDLDNQEEKISEIEQASEQYHTKDDISKELSTGAEIKSPFPWAAVLGVTIALITDGMSIAFGGIFSVPMVVNQFNIPDNEAGFYVGYFAGAYFLGQLCGNYVFGLISDKKGRKYVILFGVLSNAVFTAMFGSSPWLWYAILIRFLNGLGTSNMPITKCVIRDVCRISNQARGFGIREVGFSVGSALGPILGSILARPSDDPVFSNTIFGSEYFIRFPYALPAFAIAAISLIILVITYFVLPETLPPRVPLPTAEIELEEVISERLQTSSNSNKADASNGILGEQETLPQPQHSPANESGKEDTQPQTGTFLSRCKQSKFAYSFRFMNKGVAVAIILYGIVAYTLITIAQIFPVWAIRDEESDGLNYTDRQIGIVNGLAACIPILFQLICFSPLDRWIGSINAFRIAMRK